MARNLFAQGHTSPILCQLPSSTAYSDYSANIAFIPQWICHVLLWINILFYVSALVAGNLICMPFQRIYDKTVPGYCWNGRPLNLAIGSFNVISDFLLLLLPQRAIWTLNMPTKKKAGIALIFAIGIM